MSTTHTNNLQVFCCEIFVHRSWHTAWKSGGLWEYNQSLHFTPAHQQLVYVDISTGTSLLCCLDVSCLLPDPVVESHTMKAWSIEYPLNMHPRLLTILNTPICGSVIFLNRGYLHSHVNGEKAAESSKPSPSSPHIGLQHQSNNRPLPAPLMRSHARSEIKNTMGLAALGGSSNA